MPNDQSPNYIFHIIEKNPLFSRDLSEGLAAACSHSEVHIHPDIASAMAFMKRIAQDAAARLVIVATGTIAEIDASGLAGLAERLKATIVLREGSDPTAAVAARSWLSLSSPFTSEAIDQLGGQLPD